MKPSSASVVAYDLRPAKQAERRILLDYLKSASEVGIAISDCRYVGLGGTRFYDFHLLHRFLGVRHMTSLEQDTEIYPRAKFNCPFEYISVLPSTVTDFLDSDTDKSPTIYWLDYDGGLCAEITADIMSLGATLTVGGFVFVTVNASASGAFEHQSNEERLSYFLETLGDFSAGLTASDMENAVFPQTVHRVLRNAFKHAFAARSDGELLLMFQIEYQDTSRMITIGGSFCKNEQSSSLVARLKKNLPFLQRDVLYKIQNLTLTERERSLFDMAVSRRRSNCREANKLRSLGFKKKHFDAYRDLVRFLPRYHESII